MPRTGQGAGRGAGRSAGRSARVQNIGQGPNSAQRARIGGVSAENSRLCRDVGSRCEIFTSIDALNEARTVAGLVRRLQPILNELAYSAVTGESAVMEARETWHNQYIDALYAATNEDASSRGASARQAQDSPRGAHRQRPQTAPVNRPRPEHLPCSLRAIFNGSHHSLVNGDR